MLLLLMFLFLCNEYKGGRPGFVARVGSVLTISTSIMLLSALGLLAFLDVPSLLKILEAIM